MIKKDNRIIIAEYDKVEEITSLEQYNKLKLEINNIFDSKFNIEYYKAKIQLGYSPKDIERVEPFNFGKFDKLHVGIVNGKVVTMIKFTDISLFKGLESKEDFERNAGITEMNINQKTYLLSSFCGHLNYKGHILILNNLIKCFSIHDRLILHCVEGLVELYKEKWHFTSLGKIEYGNFILTLMELNIIDFIKKNKKF